MIKYYQYFNISPYGARNAKNDLVIKNSIHYKIQFIENRIDGALFHFTGKLMQIWHIISSSFVVYSLQYHQFNPMQLLQIIPSIFALFHYNIFSLIKSKFDNFCLQICIIFTTISLVQVNAKFDKFFLHYLLYFQCNFVTSNKCTPYKWLLFTSLSEKNYHSCQEC